VPWPVLDPGKGGAARPGRERGKKRPPVSSNCPRRKARLQVKERGNWYCADAVPPGRKKEKKKKGWRTGKKEKKKEKMGPPSILAPCSG